MHVALGSHQIECYFRNRYWTWYADAQCHAFICFSYLKLFFQFSELRFWLLISPCKKTWCHLADFITVLQAYPNDASILQSKLYESGQVTIHNRLQAWQKWNECANRLALDLLYIATWHLFILFHAVGQLGQLHFATFFGLLNSGNINLAATCSHMQPLDHRLQQYAMNRTPHISALPLWTAENIWGGAFQKKSNPFWMKVSFSKPKNVEALQTFATLICQASHSHEISTCPYMPHQPPSQAPKQNCAFLIHFC